MSQLTTHILDTSIGKPAQNVSITLEKQSGSSWNKIAAGVTNADGRIGNLLAEDKLLDKGIYRLLFDTKTYFAKQNIKSFYPGITVEFEITDGSHYHVPLLLNPFGYSTYRGS